MSSEKSSKVAKNDPDKKLQYLKEYEFQMPTKSMKHSYIHVQWS